MFKFEKLERYIIIILIICMLAGVAAIQVKRYAPGPNIHIGKFKVFNEDAAESHALVNINYASSSDLMKLKGVGNVLAERIVNRRSSKGFFLYKDDLKEVKGVGAALFSKIKDKITV